ncbi:MAG: hypothetical protein ACFFDH_14280 [Promethearchaeota archaeon]
MKKDKRKKQFKTDEWNEMSRDREEDKTEKEDRDWDKKDDEDEEMGEYEDEFHESDYDT